MTIKTRWACPFSFHFPIVEMEQPTEFLRVDRGPDMTTINVIRRPCIKPAGHDGKHLGFTPGEDRIEA